MVVADDSGAVALAGVMGGASTEIGPRTSVGGVRGRELGPGLDRAYRPPGTACPARRRERFERGVDPAIAGVALARCVGLLAEYGGATRGRRLHRRRRAPGPGS